MRTISLATAIIISERSRSTWWRRIADGAVARVADDSKGRAVLRWEDVLPQVCVPLQEDDKAHLLRADAGDAAAQGDMGQLFATHQKFEIAVYWLRQAAEQGEADAMQWLGSAYAAGSGVSQDDNLAIMWIAKAAAHGHLIALEQMRGMRRGAVESP